jgi:serine/threonine protein kinase
MLVQELQAGDPQLIGSYRVVRRLGSGGMGHVFLSRSPGGRLLAIKVIRAELASDLEFRTRFRREVAAARSVSGLFTAPVVDADTEAPVPWLATAYIAGSSLADTVTRHGPLPAASVLALAAGLAEGLLAIHSAGLVHRDLKPSNVLLADDGPRVIDFGISRAMEASTVTSTGMVVGSPGFMSPEQAEGLEVGPPSDVFSLGAVLAFAATGEGPFGSGSSAALIYRLVHNPPDLNRVPAETRSLIERCLDKDPGRRPSPRHLLAELGEAGLTPGWLPEPLVQDTGQPGPATPVPPSGLSAPPAFGSPSASFPAAPVPFAGTSGGPASGAFPAGTGGMMADGGPAGGPGDPLTITHARRAQPPASQPQLAPPSLGQPSLGQPSLGQPGLGQPVPPPWPGGGPAVPPSGGRRSQGRRRSLVIAGIAAALVVAGGGVTAGIVSAGGSKHPAAQSALKAQTQVTASPSSPSAASASATQSQQQGARRKRPGAQTASPTATATAAHSAKPSPAPHATKSGSGLRPARLSGTWTGSYFCPQGQTGLRLTLKATSSGGLTATFSFYPTSTNVSVPSGSFALTGSYTAKGFQLTPDHWISKPQNYSMVGLTGAANASDTALSGSIVSPGCTTFSVSR